MKTTSYKVKIENIKKLEIYLKKICGDKEL